VNAFIVFALITLGYMFVCTFWPYTNCGKCKGTSRFGSPSGKNFRLCGRCSGSGRTVRVGHRVLSFLGIVTAR
jgi:DnaJ-class molecular chaperone